MKVIYAFIRTAFHNAFIYRLDFWVRLISIFIMMYASYSLWSILYQQTPDAFGMDLETMTTYGVLGMLLISFMDVASDVSYYIGEQVRLGTLELDLMKPIDFIFHMFYRNLGDFVLLLVTNGLPGLLFAYIFLDFNPPVSLQAGLAFILSLFLGYVVFFGISFLVGMLSIVTLDIRSYSWVFWSVVMFASGQLVPIWMFPPALAAIVTALPFKDIYFAPMSIYVGAQQESLAAILLSQVAWAVGLLLASWLVWMRVQRRIQVQGG
jgi:ABC-2 type transport system permease protein